MANTSTPSAELDTAVTSTEGEHGQMPHTGDDAVASTAAEGHGAPHAEPKALGMDATAWVALAMILVIALLLWKKVPAAIGKALDKKIDGIRQQLDEAAQLRAEAEALRNEYQAKAASAEAEAAAVVERARHEADAIVRQAQADSDALIERRGRMAEDKIAAAERHAIEEIRAKAAAAAAAAAERLISAEMDPSSDRALVDRTIAGLGTTH
ncbi:F0F1 ATP synthase subunit B [Sphingomonas parva]|uniref:ATP synthase subunit b n=1 Tax=Sphingomonas parva TaxID=2555898 RepID=A0A4Y8ZKC3_9SPHN|nr:F0F1 ATP synthase subunit B [Sphingomonas parva]